jgi:hypothetical protein
MPGPACGISCGIINSNDIFAGKLAANSLSLLSHRVAWVPGHTGIVRCLNIAENKIYSGGYDKKLVVQEVVSLSGDGEIPLKIVGG